MAKVFFYNKSFLAADTVYQTGSFFCNGHCQNVFFCLASIAAVILYAVSSIFPTRKTKGAVFSFPTKTISLQARTCLVHLQLLQKLSKLLFLTFIFFWCCPTICLQLMLVFLQLLFSLLLYVVYFVAVISFFPFFSTTILSPITSPKRTNNSTFVLFAFR